MLNECKLAADAVERTGFDLSDSSPDVQDVVDRGLIVERRDDGNFRVAAFDENRKLWKYAPNNQIAFPSGKLIGPFYRTEKEDEKYFKLFKNKEIGTTEKLAALRELVGARSIVDDEDWLRKNFWKRWREYPRRIADAFLPLLDPTEEFAVILTQHSEGPEFSVDEARQILARLAAALLEGCEEGRLPFETVQTLLASDAKPKDVLFFHDGRPSPLTDAIRRRLNELILKNPNAVKKQVERSKKKTRGAEESERGKRGICSLTGRFETLVQGTFPQVNLPVFGQKTCLLAMNKDVPCHERYGVIAADICPVGETATNKIAKALACITSKENKGKTWTAVPTAKRKRDLLIAYCEDDPTTAYRYADTIGGDENDDSRFVDDEESEDESDESREESAKRVVENVKTVTKTAVHGIDGKTPDARNRLLRCLILGEVDTARRQVVYADAFTTDELFDAGESWREGANNVPEIASFFSLKKNVPARRRVPIAPSLKRTVRLFQKQWGSDPTRPIDVAGLPFHEIFAIFLERDNIARSPADALSLLLRQTERLLAAVGEAACVGDFTKRNVETGAKKTMLEVVALFGVFMMKIEKYNARAAGKQNDSLHYRKEKYMQDAFYQLGRLLTLLDRLHVAYCQDMRDGDIPPALIGNAAIPVVNANAFRAFARLSERLHCYLGWATRYANSTPKPNVKNADAKSSDAKSSDAKASENQASKKPEPRLVGWLLKELGAAADRIQESGLPNRRLNDVEKAQLLLGYLAFPKTSKTDRSEMERDDASDAEVESPKSL